MSRSHGAFQSLSTDESSRDGSQFHASKGVLLLVALYAAALFLPTIGDRRVLTYHEVLAAQPAREMLHNHRLVDWIIPKFGGMPRKVKPPTTGWLIAESMKLFHSENEWVVRLPSALSVIATALIMSAFATRWLGARGGVIAGFMQASFAYVLVQGRLAEADMPMCAAVCLAMYAFAVGNIDSAPGASRSIWWPILFYLGVGLSCLIKGVGPIFIFAGIATFLVVIRIIQPVEVQRTHIAFLLNPVGLVVLAICSLSWPVAAWWVSPDMLHVWWRELFRRAAGEYGTPQPFYFYLIAVPLLLLPWLPFVIVGFFEAIGRLWIRRPIAIFLLCWFIPGIVILSLSAFKHHHYAIPMLPAATLPAAGAMVLWLEHLQSLRARMQPRRVLLPVAIWTVLCALVAAAMWRWVRIGAMEICVTAGTLALGGTIIVYAIAAARWRLAAVSIFATTLLVANAAAFLVIPKFDDYRLTADFARRADKAVPSDETIYLLALGEHQAAFYLRMPVIRVEKSADIPPWIASSPHGQRFAICPLAYESQLRAMAHVRILDRVERPRAGKLGPEQLLLVRITP